MNETFSSRLISLRNERNMTQNELADQMGISRQAISKWERGEGLPDLYNLTLLAKILHVSTDELLNTPVEQPSKPEDSPFETTGNYLKRLLYKAKHTSNSAQAKKIKKSLLLIGGIGIIVGFIMSIGGFVGFAKGGIDSVVDFNGGNTTSFNPLPYMLLIIVGAVIISISLYVLLGGLGIVIVGATTSYLDTRPVCPKCGKEVGSDEKVCSHCGYDFSK